MGPLAVSAWTLGVPFGLSSPHPRGGADAELFRLFDSQPYVVSTATLRVTRPWMDAAIPLWRTGIHALATDYGCKAEATGKSSPYATDFVIVLNQRVPADGSGCHSEGTVS